jgi:Zn-dependent protease
VGGITAGQSEERRALAAKFREVLAEAMSHREERDGHSLNPYGAQELAWIGYERRCMWDAVQGERAARGLPDVTLADVFRIEVRATGHSDYARQFAFHCAELAMGLNQ